MFRRPPLRVGLSGEDFYVDPQNEESIIIIARVTARPGVTREAYFTVCDMIQKYPITQI
jgi:hypothetical protein